MVRLMEIDNDDDSMERIHLEDYNSDECNEYLSDDDLPPTTEEVPAKLNPEPYRPLQVSRSPSRWKKKTIATSKLGEGFATKGALNAANASLNTSRKTMESLTTTPTMTSATSSTSGEMHALSSSPKATSEKR
jgi:hypothetical protein